MDAATCKKELDELIENGELAEADKDAILYKNAVRFYGIGEN